MAKKIMEYKLINATTNDADRLINYKLSTTIEEKMPKAEKTKIETFVRNRVPGQIENYKLIKVGNKIVGCLLVVAYEDGVLIDEIFIEKEFRNQGIGSAIIKDILKQNPIVYLWVYKTNKLAQKLYKSLGFKTITTTATRQLMQFKTEK